MYSSPISLHISLILVCCLTTASARAADRTHTKYTGIDLKSPIVFIPGDGGTQLQARLNKTSRVHYICDLVSDWYDLWLNVHLLAPMAIDCLVDNMRLEYNFTDRKTYNSPGVEIRPTSFGSLGSVDYLDIVHLPKTDYFAAIINKLEQVNGYQPNVNMLGAGYDFRKAPNELDEFFANLTDLLETTYLDNGYRPLTLICHSMGCLNTVHYLNRQSQEWKDQHIKRLISIAAPWSGSYKAITAMMFGDNLGVYLLSSIVLQKLQSSFPSLTYLFPVEPAFHKNRLLIETSVKNYTLANMDEFFVDRNLSAAHAMWQDTTAIMRNLSAPHVELWCLYGSGIKTPSKLVFTGGINSTKVTEIEGDGDGTVNLESLASCTRWRQDQKEPIYAHQFAGLDHVDVLRKDDVATFIATKIVPLGDDDATQESIQKWLSDDNDGKSLTPKEELQPYRYPRPKILN